MNFYLALFYEHYRDFKVALAVYYSVKTNSVKFYIDKNPKFCRSAKLHHLSRTGTIGKRYPKIINTFCDPHKSRCIKCENGHERCTLMKDMIISF